VEKQITDLLMNVIMTVLSCVAFYWLKVIDTILLREAIGSVAENTTG
jgi:hypothetical protein